MIKTYTILVLAGCAIGVSLSAQTSKKDTLIQRDLIMEKEYKPVVENAEIILELPDIEEQVLAKQAPEFSVSESPAFLQGEYVPLPAARFKTSFPFGNQFGYIRLGVGGHRSFLGDAQFNLLRKSKQTLDINFQHRSIFGDMTLSAGEKQRAYMNNNSFLATYKLHLIRSEIDADLSEKYNSWNYYGTWRTDSLGPNALSVPEGQWSLDSKFGIGLKSKNLGQPFSYILYAESRGFRLGRGATSALSIPADAKGGLEKETAARATLNYDLNNVFHLGIDAHLRSFKYRPPVSRPADETGIYDAAEIAKNFEDRNWFEFNPYAKMTYKKWMLSAGFKMSIPTLESERVRWNITASASTPLGEKAAFRVALDGGVKPQSYREGIEMNPYIDPSIRLKSSWKLIDLNAGIDYRLSQKLRLSPLVSYDISTDMPFFYNGYPSLSGGVNDAYGNLFSVKYMTSNRLRIGVNSLYSLHRLLTILGEVSYNKYLNYSNSSTIDDLLKANGRKAWNKPGMEMRLRADITPVEKVNIFVDYKMEALRYTADATNFCRRMDDIHNIDLGVNYKLTKEVGTFLHVNNLLDQRYEVWNAYQVHGFTAVIGGSVSF